MMHAVRRCGERTVHRTPDVGQFPAGLYQFAGRSVCAYAEDLFESDANTIFGAGENRSVGGRYDLGLRVTYGYAESCPF